MPIIVDIPTTPLTYSWLKSEVAAYLHRTDLTAKIATFISTAESFLFRELHAKELQTSVTGVTVNGYAFLPDDFLSVSRVSITYQGAARTLDYIAAPYDPVALDVFPGKYSLENDQLRIWGSGSGQAYTLYYIPKIQPLSDLVPTNWILENSPDLYLYASALEGARYVRNEAEINKLSALVPTLLDGVKRFSERRGQPATGSLQIKVRR